MKKSLIALAVMAAAGAANAQSSVTLFGIVDAAVSWYDNGGASGGHVTKLTNSGYNSSRLGFRGTEDLGGGTSASFWLEAGVNNDDGTGAAVGGGLNFNRRSTVSLAGGWGELRLGRDYTSSFWNMTVFDPFGTNGIGTQVGHKVKVAGTSFLVGAPVQDPAYVRASNMVGYFLPPNLGGFYGQIQYAFDEQARTNANTGNRGLGSFAGARLGWASGPFNIAAAYGQTEGTNPPGFVPGTAPDVKNWNVGGQWDFGIVRIMGVYDDAEYEGSLGASAELKSWTLGALFPVGAGEFKLSYGQAKLETANLGAPKADQWAIGYVHNLSKRTALYATYASLNNKGGSNLVIGGGLAAAADQRGSGFDLGIRHSF